MHKELVIIGSSMAGLVTARVLSEHFERVTIVDRDDLRSDPDVRAGVPQSNQVHVLLAEGRRLLNGLFPTLDATLAAAGAEETDWVSDSLLISCFGVGTQLPSGAVLRPVSRGRLEKEVRKLVLALPNVRLLGGVEVRELMFSADKKVVTGVQLTPRQGADAAAPSQITADLIVDASGRSSKLPEWLPEAGYEAPEVWRVNGKVSYSTVMLKNVTLPANKRFIWVGPRAHDVPRCGMVFRVEDEKYMALIYGVGPDHIAPTEPERFMAFAQSLIDPAFYTALASAEMIGEPRPYRRTDSSWRRYTKLARFPERLLPIGDAMCSFNPVYGQGITVAIQEAMLLKAAIAAEADLQKGVRRALNGFDKLLPVAWDFAIGEDYRYATTEGPPITRQIRFAHVYLDHVLDLCASYPLATRTFARVINCLDPATALFRPAIFFRVLLRMIFGKNPRAALRAKSSLTPAQIA